MAKIGRVDVYFSTKDKSLWDLIENIEQGDRGYWLKHYAAIGIAASQADKPRNNNVPFYPTAKPLEVPSLVIPTPPIPNNQPPKHNRKTRPSKEVSPTLKDNTIHSTNPLPLTKEPAHQSSQTLISDPMEKRRAAMGNMVQADDDLLTAIQETKPTNNQ